MSRKSSRYMHSTGITGQIIHTQTKDQQHIPRSHSPSTHQLWLALKVYLAHHVSTWRVADHLHGHWLFDHHKHDANHMLFTHVSPISPSCVTCQAPIGLLFQICHHWPWTCLINNGPKSIILRYHVRLRDDGGYCQTLIGLLFLIMSPLALHTWFVSPQLRQYRSWTCLVSNNPKPPRSNHVSVRITIVHHFPTPHLMQHATSGIKTLLTWQSTLSSLLTRSGQNLIILGVRFLIMSNVFSGKADVNNQSLLLRRPSAGLASHHSGHAQTTSRDHPFQSASHWFTSFFTSWVAGGSKNQSTR